MERYYNLKRHRPDVMGGVIKVNTTANRLEKLAHINGDFIFSPVAFRFVTKEGDDDIYEFLIPNEKAVNSPMGIPVSVKTGEPDSIMLRITPSGNLSLQGEPKVPIYLTEISKQRADELEEKASNWAFQRAYIFA